MTEDDVRAIMAWRYDVQYSIYNIDGDGDDPDELLAEFLDRRSPYFAARNPDVDPSGAVVGFFCYGSSAGVTFGEAAPYLYNDDGSLNGGLGMRPDLTGRGLGAAFTQAGVAFGAEQYHPAFIRFYVLPFNDRAIRAYERVGFRRVGIVIQRSVQGERPFVEMRLP
jgi:RimJ/RimL family protein N-acetyltransferase